MKQIKSTKVAFLVSVLSMVLCIAMLVGSTFAWFTDTATAGVNTIQSGTLDLVLYKQVKTESEGTVTESWVELGENETLGWVAADGRTSILWEPGCTYALPTLKIVNNGNLALKYKVIISGIAGDNPLLKAIEFNVLENGATEAQPLADMVGSLLPKAGDATEGGNKIFTISGHMKEDATNEYQGLKLDGIKITVIATQDTYEKDGKDDQYDQEAWNWMLADEVTTENFAEVLKSENLKTDAPNYVKMTQDITSTLSGTDKAIKVPASATVNMDLGTKTFEIQSSEGKNGIIVEAGAKATFSNGTIEMNKTYGNSNSVVEAKGSEVTLDHMTVNNTTKDGVSVSSSSNGNLIIKDSTIIGSTSTFFSNVYCASQGSIVIENSTIIGSIRSELNGNIELRGGDYKQAAFYGEKSNIVIYAGTFSVDPKASGCKIADGRTVTDNGDGTWTVA